MPFLTSRRKAEKPLSCAYPKTLQSIGDHLRKKRLDLKLFQKDIAELVGVDTNSITNWELGRSRPRLYLMPKVIEFLGYIPLGINPATLGAHIKKFRIENGLSLKKLAKKIGVDPGTLTRWEREKAVPRGEMRILLEQMLQFSLTTKAKILI